MNELPKIITTALDPSDSFSITIGNRVVGIVVVRLVVVEVIFVVVVVVFVVVVVGIHSGFTKSPNILLQLMKTEDPSL